MYSIRLPGFQECGPYQTSVVLILEMDVKPELASMPKMATLTSTLNRDVLNAQPALLSGDRGGL